MSFKDAFQYLPASRPAPKKLGDQARLKQLADYFAPHVSEPKNSGVKKEVGPKMIRAVAKAITKKARG